MSHFMGKPTICICENKCADQLRSYCEADHTFVFAALIVQFLYFLNPKFPVSSHLLCLYSPICVGPVRKPHCSFSHEAAQLLQINHSLFIQIDFFSGCSFWSFLFTFSVCLCSFLYAEDSHFH